MSRLHHIVLFVMMPLAGVGCVTGGTGPVAQGEIQGRTLLAWEDGFRFVYIPKPSDPLIYTFPKSNPLSATLGKIQPGTMYTDGGSIPRLFWSQDGLSPWDYGPAFILHDWIFNRHYCRSRDLSLSLAEANAVLYDALEIVDRQRKKDKSPNAAQARKLIRAAVDAFSGQVWKNGACPKDPPPEFDTVTVRASEPMAQLNGERAARQVAPVSKQVRRQRLTILGEIY